MKNVLEVTSSVTDSSCTLQANSEGYESEGYDWIVHNKKERTVKCFNNVLDSVRNIWIVVD